VFERPHSIADELAWLRSEGPYSPALLRHVRRLKDEIDFFLFVSCRYYHAIQGARAVPDKAVLVPTAERDPAIGLGLLPPIFRGVRAIAYNTPEERAMIEGVSHRQGPAIVVGTGSAIPAHADPGRFRRKFSVQRPFAIYVGRIDPNKGCVELLDYFARYAEANPKGLDLVLVGSAQMEVPDHPRIRLLGFLTDQDKFDALGAADVLVMPSPFESLSMVVLEAWALGKPVLVNGHCDVLRGQCVRSGGGLAYESAEEFVEALYVLEGSGPAGAILGRQGRDYFRRHYTWPVVEQKYRDLFDRLTRDPVPPGMAPLPGWFARRRRTLPPARAVVDALPTGPAVH
jgi:glycosyltransferase involved in cell wall biosynthesis